MGVDHLAAREEAMARARKVVEDRRKASMMGAEPDLPDLFSQWIATFTLALSFLSFIGPAALLMLLATVRN